jgi:hypothetical protein
LNEGANQMKTGTAFRLAALVMAAHATSAQAALPIVPCPILIPQIWTHRYSDTDPWHSALWIKITNTTPKAITAIRFGVAFTDAFGTRKVSPYGRGSDLLLKPGKSSSYGWDDGVEAGDIMRRTGAIVWMEKVLFADGSVIVDDGTHSCGGMVGPQ